MTVAEDSNIASPTYEYDDEVSAIEGFFERGFTDGLPVIPPTPARVEAMLATTGFAPDDLLGEVPTRNVVVTAEKTAINAVMAGCRPEYFPTVVATVRAFLQPKASFSAPWKNHWPGKPMPGPNDDQCPPEERWEGRYRSRRREHGPKTAVRPMHDVVPG